MSKPVDNLAELRDALRADAPGVAEALLGAPNKAASSKKELRWGTKGSLSLRIEGKNKGLWFSHENLEGSDLIGLIRHVKGYNHADALRWASDRTGIAVDCAANDDAQSAQRRAQQDADRRARLAEAEARAQAEADTERRSSIAWVQRVVGETVSADGTLADWYLRQARGISRPTAGWPDAVRWHSGYRALVLVATRADGTVQRLQRVHLAASGEKIGAEEAEQRGLPAVKVTNGPQDGAVVRLPGDPAGPLLLCEGPETGLTGWVSTRYETWIALGGIGNLTPPAGRQIVICRDDDKGHSLADKKLGRVLAEWRRAGIAAVVATPWPVRRGDKSDLADVILAHGVEAVRLRIQAALAPSRAPVQRVPVREARRQVATAVGAFFGRVDRLSISKVEQDKQDAAKPPVMDTEGLEAVLAAPIPNSEPLIFTHGVRVTVGVGKSHEARAAIASTLVAMRARGDMRTIVLALPTHALGDEQAAAFMGLPEVRAAGLKVAIWRGRETPDPAHSDYLNAFIKRDQKTSMCQDIERVRDAQSIGLSAQTAACKRRIKQSDGTKQTVTCPLFSKCSYQKQNEREADLWLMSHDLLFHQRPAVMGEVAAVVVDESAWRRGTLGAEGKHLTLSVDALGEDAGSARLADLRRQLLDALRLCPIGPVPAATLKYAHLDADGAAEAIKLEYARKVDPLHPGQTRKERREAMEQAAGNITISRLVMAWNAVREMLTPGGSEVSGWLEMAVEPTDNGPVRVLRLKGRKKVSDGFKAPTLLLDALLPVKLVRPFWPDVELAADVQAAMPHQYIRQVVDRAYSLSMLEPLTVEAAKADPKEAARRANRLRDVRAVIVREARRHAPGGVLVVLQQAVERALHALGPLPGNIMTAHHNNIAGVDRWKDVRALIVVGRTMPPPNGVERIAEALTGRATAAPLQWYERADAVREMADGSTVPADADRHTDPIAELVRWQIAEGEVVQIIGRPRGVNRTAADPVDVLVLTDVSLPMPLAGTLMAADLEPSVADHMLAAGGVVLENPSDAAAAYPDLWPNREAAKKALQRGKLGTFPYNKLYIGECPQLRRIDYKAAGQGKQAAVAGFDPVLCPNPEAFLASALGPLVWCKVEDVPSPEPDPPLNAAVGEVSTDVSDDLKASAPTCDVPWLHPAVSAYAGSDGRIVVEQCPFCGGQHRHTGFGHRLAHCDDPGGRGYLLRDAGPAPSWVVQVAPTSTITPNTT